MPWVDVDEPFSKPPRYKPVAPTATWSVRLDHDDGWAELADVSVDRTCDWDLTGVTELSVSESLLNGVSIADPQVQLDVRRSGITGCDLSRATIRSLVSTRLDGCKLTGTDLSGATVHDVEFHRCHFRHANLRMAQLRRVRFEDCSFDDVDCFQMQAEDVEFPGSSLDQVNVDRLRATRVDLRGATSVALSGIGSLTGCLVGEHQVPALAYPLIFAVGADVERSES